MKILLHVCCSNCAIYPFKLLRSDKQNVTGLWFNPNIHPFEEYDLRLKSLKRLAGDWNVDMEFIEDYRPEEYFRLFGLNETDTIISGDDNKVDRALTSAPPFPERCRSCYALRLEKTADEAQKSGFHAFSTTLLISPYQDFKLISNTGKALSEKYNIEFYLQDFRPFFRDAMNSAKEMGLYRQKYCGCIFSKRERLTKKGSKGQRDKGTEKRS